jgi:hypothetical protein
MPIKNCFAFTIEGEEDYHFPTPEQALCWAILERALLDMVSKSDYAPSWAREDAQNWFLGKYEDPPGFSFLEVCEALCICPSVIEMVLKKKDRFILIRNRFVPYKVIKSILD